MKPIKQINISTLLLKYNFIRIALSLCLFLIYNTPVFSQSFLWAIGTGGTGADGVHAVITDSGGSVYVTGGFSSPTITFGSSTFTNAGNYDFFIAKYDTNGNLLWAKSAGGANEDDGWSLSTDAGGNVFVTGQFWSPTITFGSITLINAGVSNVFVAKYDANGNVLWAKSATGAGGDQGYSVSADASGNVFVTGVFWSPTITFDSYTLTNAGNSNVFIAKYDPNGNVLWVKSAGGTSQDGALSVSVDPSGNAFITGEFFSPTITFGTTTLTNSGTISAFIAKYSPNGIVLWAKSPTATGGDYGNSVSADANGNVFVTGWFASPLTIGSTTLNNVGNYDTFLAKYDSNGNVLWAKSAGGTGIDNGTCVSADVNGNVFLSGWFDSPTITFGSTTLTQPPGSFQPIFIAKYDAGGNVSCTSVLASGNSAGFEKNITTDPVGNVYIGGGFWINPFIVGSDTLTLSGQENIFLAKYTCGSNFSANVSNTTILCYGTCTGTATVTPINGNSPYSYSWNTVPIQTTQTATGLCEGNYQVIVNDASGYADTVITTILQPIAITANAGTNITILSGSSTLLNASGGNTYSWSPSTGLSCTTCANPLASPLITTDYCVTVTDTNSCTDSACIRVTIEIQCPSNNNFSVPNAFSPNNDGHNDVLKLDGWKNCVTEFTFSIYDRWGEKVFESDDPAKGWDGVFKGKFMDPGVFVYYINATTLDGEKIFKKGNISLIR